MKNKKIWVVTEGMIGTENQCLAVTDQWGVEPVVHRVALNEPWKTLSPWLGFENTHTFVNPFAPPWPDLLIASGRKSIAASRYIKRQSGGHTRCVYIQDPKWGASVFDLVAVPQHDGLRGDHVLVLDAAPNRITPDRLVAAKAHFSPLFENIKAPRIAVLIGGNSRTHRMTPAIAKKIVAQLSALDAGLMVTVSRRTPEDCMAIFREGFQDHYFWDGTGENPYHGMLAWADYICVTADSVSMVSDAATTGNPVYLLPLEGGSKRFDKFAAHLKSVGAVKDFEGALQAWSYTPLNDAQKIARAIEGSFDEEIKTKT